MSPKRFIFTITWVKSNLEELPLDLLFCLVEYLNILSLNLSLLSIFISHIDFWIIVHGHKNLPKVHNDTESPIWDQKWNDMDHCFSAFPPQFWCSSNRPWYCSVLSLGGNVNTRRMSNSDMGSIFHIKINEIFWSKETLMHLFLFINSAQRELVSICTQSIRDCN